MYSLFSSTETTNSVGERVDLNACVGHHRCPYLQQLGLVHAPRQAAHVYALHSQI